MKTLSPKQRAYKILTSNSFVLIGKMPKLDRRLKETNEILKHINSLKKELDFKLILSKKRVRANQKSTDLPKNVLSNPLFLDLKNNRKDVRFYNENVVNFIGGRNHYAKSYFDKKIISVFKKNSLQK